MTKAPKIPERLEWAIDALELKPSDHVLEIGCGPGVAASLVCERLKRGSLLAIDRSATAITAARKRNLAHVRSKRVQFRKVAVEAAELGSRRFNKIFAFNVGSLRNGLATELPRLTRALRAHGSLVLFEQPPSAAQTAEVAESWLRALQDQGLTVRDIILKELEPAPVVCVIADKSKAVAADGGAQT